ncbi:carboxylesterase/lipase family protein [Plantibacter sp. YIM 135347]|uniref:carboxylesterase/lipase family protein n=1 Tax=Plantibacter sp. YIM 135347 TaxID=3423919 RepID=UPI003D3417AF
MRDTPIVKTQAGAVRGVWTSQTQAAFLGIPYAEPPVGELRFAAPVPRSPWAGTRQADAYGATPLRDYMTGITAIPEPSYPGDDTLRVNVFTPKPGDRAAALPVFVWIHGGGFTTGSPSSSWYAGGSFPRDGVVVVSVSYRLGFDGFGVIPGAPSNRAVLDWLLALQWVQDNIAGFGGDPGRVTIGGQSAGGTAVLTLLSMPSAQPLFRSAVAESPAAAEVSPAVAERWTAALASSLGVSPDRDGFASVPEQRVFDAQSALSKKAIRLTPAGLRAIVSGEDSTMQWGPVVDGELIPLPLAQAFARGIGADKPLLIGATSNEVTMLLDRLRTVLRAVPRKAALRLAGLSGAGARIYASARPDLDTADTLGQLMTDAVFRFGVAKVVRKRAVFAAKAGQRATAAPGPAAATGPGPGQATNGIADTWTYDFAYPSADTGMAQHCIELPFVWDRLDGENVVERNTGANPPQAIADAAHGAWVRFIASCDPGWTPDRPARHIGMRFDSVSAEVDAPFGFEGDFAARFLTP